MLYYFKMRKEGTPMFKILVVEDDKDLNYHSAKMKNMHIFRLKIPAVA